MKFRCLLVLVLGLFVMGADKPKDDASKKDLDKLKGTWTATKMEHDGDDLLGNRFKELKLTFDGDKVSVKSDLADLDNFTKLTIKIDPSTKPKLIDFTVSIGSEKGTVFEGIYKLDGEELTICTKVAGKDRPSEFATKVGSDLALVVLKKDKP